MKRFSILLALTLGLGCEHSAPTKEAAASSTPVAAAPVHLAPADDFIPEYQIVAPDSAVGAWYLDVADLPAAPEFFVASHVRHPSGVMVIWYDTATRATEDHGVGRVHADSVVVEGLLHGEYLGRICVDHDGATEMRVIGLVGEADTTAVPRRAWKFNAETFHIDQFPVDSIRCMVNEPIDDVD